ncbi:MAG: type 4a pilus biogenesis protein PilO [Candidatus Omnitrophota bacterium]
MDIFGISSYFNKLKKREKILAVALIIALLGALGYRAIAGTYFSGQKKFKADLQKIQHEIEIRKAKFPDIESQEAEIEKLRSDYENTLKGISGYEAGIPSVDSVRQLLSEITRRSEGLDIDFESIRQDIEKQKEGYLKLNINMKFSASYSNVVNYLNRLDNLSDFLSVSNIDIAQNKEGGPRSVVDLELSMLLAEKGIDLSVVKKELAVAAPLTIKSNPFISKKTESLKKKEAQFKLAGITWANKNSTAIVNDEVLRAGSQIGGWKVIEILPDEVTLSDGEETVTLTMGR